MSPIPARRVLVAGHLSPWALCLLMVAGLGALLAVSVAFPTATRARRDAAASYRQEEIHSIPSPAGELEYWGLVR